jgi:hypothetical protein
VDLTTAHAYAVLGQLPAEDIPAIAVDALVDGLDTPTLRVLAGLVDGTPADARELFAAAVHELQLPSMDGNAAALVVVRHLAGEVVNGRVALSSGLSEIYSILRHFWDHAWRDLPPDIGAVFALDDDLNQHYDVPWLRERIEHEQLGHLASVAGRAPTAVPSWTEGLRFDSRRGWITAEGE